MLLLISYRVAARVDVEKQYLALGATLIRPGCVYGKAGSLTGMWFGGAKAGKLSLSGTGDHKWMLVHVDDLANAYVLVAEKVIIRIIIISISISISLFHCYVHRYYLD